MIGGSANREATTSESDTQQSLKDAQESAVLLQAQRLSSPQHFASQQTIYENEDQSAIVDDMIRYELPTCLKKGHVELSLITVHPEEEPRVRLYCRSCVKEDAEYFKRVKLFKLKDLLIQTCQRTEEYRTVHSLESLMYKIPSELQTQSSLLLERLSQMKQLLDCQIAKINDYARFLSLTDPDELPYNKVAQNIATILNSPRSGDVLQNSLSEIFKNLNIDQQHSKVSYKIDKNYSAIQLELEELVQSLEEQIDNFYAHQNKHKSLRDLQVQTMLSESASLQFKKE